MILTKDFYEVWHKLGFNNQLQPSSPVYGHMPVLYARGVRPDEIEYVGQTINPSLRAFQHDIDTHNRHLQQLHASGQQTHSFVLFHFLPQDLQLAEQRAVAIAKSLGKVGNAMRGGDWLPGAETNAKDLYVRQAELSAAKAEQVKATCKHLVHCILPKGAYTLRLLGFHETLTDSLVYFEDSNGWLYFNKCPKNVPAHQHANDARRGVWRSQQGLVGHPVNVTVHWVSASLLQMNIVGPSSLALTDGRAAMIDAMKSSFKNFVAGLARALAVWRRVP